MYGLINSSFREFIRESFGDDAWMDIEKKSGVQQESFLTMRQADDSSTYELLGRAAEETSQQAEKLLEDFGVYWISKVATQQYARVMRSHGESFLEFASNINKLHDQISGSFLSYQPPSFDLDHDPRGLYSFTYQSHRVGLTPFVSGLIKGLAEHFDTKVQIIDVDTHQSERGERSAFLLDIGSRDTNAT